MSQDADGASQDSRQLGMAIDAAVTAVAGAVALLLGRVLYQIALRSFALSDLPDSDRTELAQLVPAATVLLVLIRIAHRLIAARAGGGWLDASWPTVGAFAIAGALVFVRNANVAGTFAVSCFLLATFMAVVRRRVAIARSLIAYRYQLVLATLSTIISLEIVLRAHYLITYEGSLQDIGHSVELPPAGSHAQFGAIVRMSSNEGIIYELKPGLDVHYSGAHIETNEVGLREDEIPFAKPPGTRRIVGIGDSHMFGWRVGEDERYMDLLEVALNQRDPHTRWETVVLAVPGYNLSIEVEMLEALGLRYDPDLIVYGYCGNDIGLPTFVRDKADVFSLTSFIRLYFRILTNLRSDALVDAPDVSPGWSANELSDIPGRYSDLVGTEAFLQALDRLNGIARSKGIPLLYFEWDNARPDFLPDDVHHVDGRAAAAPGGPPFTVSLEDGHPSAEGHRRLSRVLLDYLVENELIGAHEPPTPD